MNLLEKEKEDEGLILPALASRSKVSIIAGSKTGKKEESWAKK